MFDRNLKKLLIKVLVAVSFFLTLFAANLVSASGGSISMAKIYPEDGERYLVIDHFIYQTSAVNINTTVSVCIDNGTLIPMAFQVIKNEIANDDNVARNWYTWQVTIPAVTNPGKHTFQFFSHYYVWQDTDHYWAELNARSTVQLFIITDTFSTPQTSTSTKIPTIPKMQPAPGLQPWIILPLVVVPTLLSTAVVRKRIF